MRWVWFRMERRSRHRSNTRAPIRVARVGDSVAPCGRARITCWNCSLRVRRGLGSGWRQRARLSDWQVKVKCTRVSGSLPPAKEGRPLEGGSRGEGTREKGGGEQKPTAHGRRERTRKHAAWRQRCRLVLYAHDRGGTRERERPRPVIEGRAPENMLPGGSDVG